MLQVYTPANGGLEESWGLLSKFMNLVNHWKLPLKSRSSICNNRREINIAGCLNERGQ
jgi:hypothetical protein